MEENIFEKEFRALGTDICIQIVVPETEEKRALLSLEESEDIYRKKELIFSRFNPNSELSRLNNNLGVYFEVSDDFVELAQDSLKCYYESGRIFDPRILDNLEKIGYKSSFENNKFGDAKENLSANIFKEDLRKDLLMVGNKIKFLKKMDFSGIAKGYITDKVANFLQTDGWKNFLVDSGGDMYACGLNKNKEKWNIALEGSENEEDTIVEISNEGIATSGNTRKNWEMDGKKFHHLINPKNINQFNFDLKSVTVITENTKKADVLAKILFILGLTDGVNFANKNNIKSIFLKDNKEALKLNL